MTCLGLSGLAQNAAPSSHMYGDDSFPGDIIINEVRVPAGGETLYTYYETLGWGGAGGGYAGIQAHENGHNFIFSIWDNPVHTTSIQAVYQGYGTLTEGFGGEGTGLKSWNFQLGWQVDKWHVLAARAWPVGNHTHFGFWVRRGDDSLWYHLVTMDVAAANANFPVGNDSFIEDWLETGAQRRETNLRKGWKRRTNGTWFPVGSVQYWLNDADIVPGGRSYNYRTKWDGGVRSDATGDFYYMITGGAATSPTTSNPSTHSIPRTDTQPSWPTFALHQLVVQALSPASLRVAWDPNLSTSPQFAYQLRVFDNPAGTGSPLITVAETAPHIRERVLNTSSLNTAGNVYYLVATFTDLFDRQITPASVSFGSGTEPGYITVTAPNGGNHLVAGTASTITWNTSLTDPLTIKLLKGGSAVATLTTTATGGSYAWTVPTAVATGSDYRVRIENASGTVADQSNSDFTVVAEHIPLAQSAITVHSFSSQQSGDEASHVLDGDPNTIWHTQYSPTTPTYPHQIVLRTDQPYRIDGLRYQARPEAGNGTIKDYEIYLSMDGSNWGTPVAAGSWTETDQPQNVQFAGQQAQYVRLKALNEINGGPWASAAELNLSYAVPPPSISINDVSRTEGNSGTTAFTFTVSLSATSPRTVTVNFATMNQTATAGSDYAATSGTLAFPPGTQSQTITVNINGDAIREPDETFSVILSSEVNALIIDNQGVGTILNDDSATDLPTARWRLDETTGPVAIEDFASRNGAFINGPTPGQPGAWPGTGTAVAFNGVDQKIDVPFDAALNPTTFTVSLWARVTGGASTFRSPMTSRDDAPARGYLIYAASDNTWQFWLGTGTGWAVVSGPPVVIGQWVHLAGTYDGTTSRFFVNGVEVGSTATAFAPNTARPFRIGGGATEGAGTFFFAGSIDDVRVWNRPLSAGELVPPISTAYGISFQINAASGRNTPGDAANEPSLCIDPTNPNRMAVGWRQFDTLSQTLRQGGAAFTTNGGLNWTRLANLPYGGTSTALGRSDPVLASDANGNFYYMALTNQTTFACNLMRSTNGGATWQWVGSALGGDKEWMAIDTTSSPGRGNIYEVWRPDANVYNNPDKVFTRSTDGGLNWMPAIGLPHRPLYSTIDVGPNGEVYVFGLVQTANSSFVLNRSSNATNKLSTPTIDLTTIVGFGGPFVDNEYTITSINTGGLLGQPWVAVDRSGSMHRGNVYVLCSVTNDPGNIANVMFRRSTDGGANFSASLRLNDDSATQHAAHWFGTLSVAPNGRVDACWYDTRNSPDNSSSELYYTYSEDGGVTWAPNRPVSPPFDHSLGYPVTSPKLGDYIQMVSLNEGACIAYAATFNGEQDLYFVRTELPIRPAITRVSNRARISWNAVPGGTYCVQAKADLSLPWSTASTVACLVSTSTMATIEDPLSAGSPRFYRVVRQQP